MQCSSKIFVAIKEIIGSRKVLFSSQVTMIKLYTWIEIKTVDLFNHLR